MNQKNGINNCAKIIIVMFSFFSSLAPSAGLDDGTSYSQNHKKKGIKCNISREFDTSFEHYHYYFNVDDEEEEKEKEVPNGDGDRDGETEEETRTLHIELIMWRQTSIETWLDHDEDDSKTVKTMDLMDRAKFALYDRFKYKCVKDDEGGSAEEEEASPFGSSSPPQHRISSPPFSIHINTEIDFSAYPQEWWTSEKIVQLFSTFAELSHIDESMADAIIHIDHGSTENETITSLDDVSRERALHIFAEFFGVAKPKSFDEE